MLIEAPPLPKPEKATVAAANLPIPAKSSCVPSAVEFELPSGVKVRFDAGVNLDIMRRALAAARELK